MELAAWILVGWFNNRRLTVPIGEIPPAKAQERCDATPDEKKLAA